MHCVCNRDVGPPKLLEATLLGLQAVRARHGADSRQAAAAAAMLQGTLAEVWAALHDATGRSSDATTSDAVVSADCARRDCDVFPEILTVCQPAHWTLCLSGTLQLTMHGMPAG